MKNRIKIGIIGAGSVFRHMHLPALLKLQKSFDITAVYDTDNSVFRKAELISGKDFIKAVNPGEIFNNASNEAVAVLTPTSSHLLYTLKSLKSGKHVFLEKPACVSVPDIKKIRDAEIKYRKFVQVGMVLRHSLFFSELKKIIDSGKYGKVLWMNWLETWPFDPMQWRYEDTEKNGDAIINDKAVHQVNLFNAFSGSAPKRVMAMGGRYLLNHRKYTGVRTFSRKVYLKGGSNDNLMCIIEYKNGVKASLNISYVSPHARESRWIIQLENAKIAAHFETFVQPLSAGKKRKWHRNPSCIYLYKDINGKAVPWNVPMSYPPSDKNLVFYDEYKNEPLHPGSLTQWKAFYETVINRKKPVCSTLLSIQDTIVTSAVQRSVNSGKAVVIK